MNIIVCSGNDPHLLHWVGTLVMDKSVLKYNNNYPYWTSENHVWHIAYDSTHVLGFIPVEQKENRWVINNYYIAEDNPEVFDALLQHVLEASGTVPVEAVAQTRHIDLFETLGFEIHLSWKKYVKMLYVTN